MHNGDMWSNYFDTFITIFSLVGSQTKVCLTCRNPPNVEEISHLSFIHIILKSYILFSTTCEALAVIYF